MVLLRAIPSSARSQRVEVKGLDDSIGEIDCCPHCKEKLDPIPKRKKECLPLWRNNLQ